MPYVRACLERSKSFGLSIDVDLQDKHTWHQTLPFLDVILPHSTRWEQFQIRFGVWKVGSGFRQALLQSLSSLQLPSLELLSLYFSHFKFYKGPFTVDTSQDTNDIHYFNQSWEMPNLRCLRIDECPNNIIAPKLNCLSLSSSPRGASAIERLRNVCASFPALQELQIDLSDIDRQDFDCLKAPSAKKGTAFRSCVRTLRKICHPCKHFSKWGVRDLPANLNLGPFSSHNVTIEIPNLRELTILAYGFDRTAIRAFMSALRAPALCKVEIMMTAPKNDNACYSVLEDFFPQEDYPALDELTLTIKADNHKYQEFCVPYAKFRGLHSLTLNTTSCATYTPSLVTEDGDICVPALHRLKVIRADDSYLHWLNEMRGAIIKKKLWAASGFKELEISSVLSSSSVCEINMLYGEEDKAIAWKDGYE